MSRLPRVPGTVASQVQQLRQLPASELPSLFSAWISMPDPNLECGIYSPLRTFWLFLWQVLTPGAPCRDAVARGAAWIALHEDHLPSGNTSGYCQARGRLSLKTISRVVREAADRLGTRIIPDHLWHELHVKVVDGSSFQASDTAENRKRWPYPAGARPGCGFPTIRVVAIFSLVTGALLEFATGPLSDHERTLWRSLWSTLRSGDLVLTDRGFGSYAEFYLLVLKGVHFVVRLSAKREGTSKVVRKLGEGDHLVLWQRGNAGARPKWMTKEAWMSLPEQLLIREITYNVAIPGFRTQKVTIATTLLDERTYPARDFADLFRQRWQVELYIRDLKTSMGMERLRCLSPAMIEKEIMMYWAAYNLIRGLMLEASLKYPCDPRELSFKGAMSFIRNWAPQLALARTEAEREHLHECLLYYIGHEVIRAKKNRVEPRAVKTRPKNYQRLTASRKKFKEIKHRNRYTKERAREEKLKQAESQGQVELNPEATATYAGSEIPCCNT